MYTKNSQFWENAREKRRKTGTAKMRSMVKVLEYNRGVANQEKDQTKIKHYSRYAKHRR